MDELEPRFILLTGALAIGVLYGIVARLTGFCLRSAVIEVAENRTWVQVRAWAAAILAAVFGTQYLIINEIVDVSESIYLGSTLLWGGAIVGGLMFGFGMMLTRGCGGRHLVLAAGGNLRSWFVLIIMGVIAYMTLRGILAIPRTALEGVSTGDLDAAGLADLDMIGMASDLTGFADSTMRTGFLGVLTAVAGVIAVRRLNAGTIGYVAGGLAIGLMIPLGWYLTGVLGFDDFEPTPLVSLTFITPVANSIQYLMTYTGSSADFGVALVGGALTGAFLVAVIRGQAGLEGFDGAPHMLRYAAGATLMGAGGVMAMGCTIGQGLTGLSTLSLGSLIAIVSIILGGRLGLAFIRGRQLAHGLPTVPSAAE